MLYFCTSKRTINVAKKEYMDTIEEKLRKHAPATPSKWREKANWRKKNKSLLRHLQQVAINMQDYSKSR